MSHIKTWKERKGLLNTEPFRAFIGVEWEMQAEIDELRAALAQPEPVPPSEIIEALCARIKAADDAAADRDYMLDSDDCIAVIRGTWKAPMMNDKPDNPLAAAKGGAV